MEPFYTPAQPQVFVSQIETPQTHRRFVLAVALVISLVALGTLTYQLVRMIEKTPLDGNQVLASSAPTVQSSPAVTAQPQPANQPNVPDYAVLAQSVQKWTQAQPNSQWGIVIQDLQNPSNRVAINADRQFESASLYKLFLTIPLASKLPFSSWQSLHTLNGQGQHTIAGCVQAMLAKSDNPCGDAIGDYVGWNTAHRTAQADGFTGTVLNSSNLQTTANDAAKFLTGLSSGQWFDAPTRDFIMQSMAAQIYRSGIPAGCPDCTVLNKTGDIDNVTHDAAIVTHGSNHYVLVAMSQGGSYAQIADLSRLVNSQL